MYTRTKYIISITTSLALALLFVLPWFSFFGDLGPFLQRIDPTTVRNRLLFLGVGTFIGALLYFQFNFFWKKAMPYVGKPWWRNLLVAMANLLLIVLFSFLLMFFVTLVFGVQAHKGFLWVYILRNVVVAFICILVVYAFEKSQDSKNVQMELLRLGNENTEIELAMLKYQLDPHFLFNCLNALSGLVRVNKQEALSFLEHFSDTFRYTLEARNHHLVLVRDEVNFVSSYLYLLQKRFTRGLHVEMHIREQDLQRKLPQFAIQLLLENAVKHNIVSTERPLSVSVISDGRFVVVRNGLQQGIPSGPNFGIGLANLRKRYGLLGYSSVDIEITEDFFEVKLLLL